METGCINCLPSLCRGISGGQAKRTSIAISMVSSPRVLFMDEATSGLDSFTANETMTLVKSLTRSEGITVCATIHSPSPLTFSLFDSLLMLLEGEVAYFGPNNCAMVDYFKGGCGITPRTSELEGGNTAEFLTNLIVGAQRRKEGYMYVEAYKKSMFSIDAIQLVETTEKQDSTRLTDEVRCQFYVYMFCPNKHNVRYFNTFLYF